MTEPIAVILQYKEDLFVNRCEEIGLVTDRLDQLLRWVIPEKRTVVFRGERGIGKSWLLKKINTTVMLSSKYEKDVIVCALDLQQNVSFDPVIAVINILKIFRKALDSTNPDEAASLTGLSRQILEEVREIQKTKVLLVILDHVYEADWKLLAGLEDYLLGPLAIEQRTLIVLGGRGRGYTWKTPELKLKVEICELQPLDSDDTEKQLKLQLSSGVALRAKQVFEVTKGNPLGNYLLGKYEKEDDGLNAFIEETLRVIPDDRRALYRQYMEALCVLNAFDEERIPKMFESYFDDSTYSKWGYGDARPVREELVKAALIRWDEEKSGFVVDPILKTALEKYLHVTNPDLWRKLENAALELYEKWVEDYPRARDFWQAQRDYHHEMLAANS